MKLLCRIGLHQWQHVGHANLLMPSDVEQCKRCHKGRMKLWEATLYYTPAQMALQGKHGTPQEFEAAVWRAHGEGFVTIEEAGKAIADYADEFNGYRGLRP